MHEEVAVLYEGNIQDKGKDTDEDGEEELCVTGYNTKNNDDNIVQNTAELFHDSADEVIPTDDSIVTNKVDIKTGSDSKRKAESGHNRTEDGKKQRSHDQK